MQRKIVIKYNTSSNEEKTKTISYASTTASDQALLNFANDIFDSLTTNYIIETSKVDTTKLVSE